MRDFQRQILMGQKVEASSDKIDRARKLLFENPSRPFHGSGRRINRFMLGADPEFIFEQDGQYVHASVLGLRPALAYGADQNTRLVEMRATPSRSALVVVASMLSTLRWLYRGCMSARTLTWRAGAFAHNDGIGGHVHFGRKRIQRALEVQALDGLAREMRRAGLFPESEWARRNRGDQFGQMYGLYGDIRPQRHGYEYRTLPSWLTSPHLAFLVITLSKLAVIDPEITGAWNHSDLTMSPWHALKGLAKFYAGRDDDAWLLSNLMEESARFEHVPGCFRARWGLSGSQTMPATSKLVLPAVIEPQKEDVEDLMALFTKQAPLVMRETAPNWKHSVPDGYVWCMDRISLGRAAGAGDAIFDTVMRPEHHSLMFDWSIGDERIRIHTPNNYRRKSELKVALPSAEICNTGAGDSRFVFSLGKSWRKGLKLDQFRKMLYSGLMPAWKVNQIQPGDYEMWKETAIPSEGNYAGGSTLDAAGPPWLTPNFPPEPFPAGYESTMPRLDLDSLLDQVALSQDSQRAA